MRVLVTSSAMVGHFGPLVPLIEALRDRGDEVLVVVPAGIASSARNLRVPVLVGGSPDPGEADELWRSFRTADPQEASIIANREIFGRLNTSAMLPGVEHAVAEHRPELVLHETTEYAGPVSALRAGVPHAQVAVSLAGVERGSLAVAAPALEQYGPIVAALEAAPFLTRFPAAIDDSPYRDTRRYREAARGAQPLPNWWGGSTAPLVYVTFGTVAPGIGSGAYRMAVEALRSLPVRVLITTGQELDLGPLPPHIEIRRWVDQQDVLGAAAVVVCHGGSGTSLGALAAGVPMVIYPMFADQVPNAARLRELGVALVVQPEGASAAARAEYDESAVAALRLAVDQVLGDTTCRTVVTALAGDLERLPLPGDVLASVCASVGRAVGEA